MLIKEVMSRDVFVTSPKETICNVARIMAESDVGLLPVGDKDRLVGMVSDRDIVIRAIAQHKSPDTPVAEVMSKEVRYCFEDEDVEHVAHNMGDIQVRRLPVLNREKRLVGIVALGDLAVKSGGDPIADALCGISQQRPGTHAH